MNSFDMMSLERNTERSQFTHLDLKETRGTDGLDTGLKKVWDTDHSREAERNWASEAMAA